MGLPAGFNRTRCGAPAGAGAAPTIPQESCYEYNLAGVSLAGLRGFNFDHAKAARPDRARTNRGDSSLEFPFASARASAQAGALGTLTVAAFMVALIDKLQAASSEPFLQTDPVTFNDLQHGTLLIGPRGGAVRNIVLDNPEMTVVVGPPQAGYPVQQVVNSPADMIALLSFSEAVNAVYQLGQADPMTTGSTGPTTQHAETKFFMPDGPPLITLATSGGLPPLPPEQLPNTVNSPFTGRFTSFPVELPIPPSRLAFAIDQNRVVSHDEQPGLPAPGGTSDDTDEDFPIELTGVVNPEVTLPVIGRARDGTPDDPFVVTAGSVFGTGNIVVTVETSSVGEPSGLSVTGGGEIFLFTETTSGGHQVVVGREGWGTTPDTPDEDGAIAFVIYVTEDGEAFWVQQSLPIDHGDDQNDFDSVLSVVDTALQLRVTLTDGSTVITQTQNVGHQVVFEDDGPVAAADTAEVGTNFNIAFVLDFSGSISNGDFNTMLDAVTDAGQAFFNNSAGDVSITVIGFASGAVTIGTFTDFQTFEEALAATAVTRGGVNTGATNYTAGIEKTMDEFVPDANGENRVFFFSDGQPNQDIGSGHSLQPATQTSWNDFVDENDISVQTIGVANATAEALQDVDEADGDNTVILIDGFDELVNTLLTLAGTASGNVLDNDAFGSDGPGFIRTLSYDSDDNGSLDATHIFDGIDSEVTFETQLGGSFTINFETGEWKYATPDDFDQEIVKRFDYTIIDGDGDESAAASLYITVSSPGFDQLLTSSQNTPVD